MVRCDRQGFRVWWTLLQSAGKCEIDTTFLGSNLEAFIKSFRETFYMQPTFQLIEIKYLCISIFVSVYAIRISC